MLKKRPTFQSVATVTAIMVVFSSSPGHAGEMENTGNMMVPPPPGPYISSRPVLGYWGQSQPKPGQAATPLQISPMPVPSGRMAPQWQTYQPLPSRGQWDNRMPSAQPGNAQTPGQGGMWRW